LKGSHFRELAWLLSLNVSAVILGFGLIKLISRIGTVEYGKFALVLSIVPLINAAVYTPIDQFCQRYFYTYLREETITSFTATVFHLLKVLGVLFGLLFTVALLVLRFGFDLDFRAVLFAAVAGSYILVFANAIPFQSLLNTMRLRRHVALLAAGEKLAQLVVLAALFSFVGLNSLWVLGVFGALGTIFLIAKIKLVKIWILEKKGSGVIHDQQRSQHINRQLLVFAFPIVAFGLLQWFQSYSERWVIQFTLDLYSVGIYAFMVMLANTSLMLVLSATSQFIGPIIWEKFSDLNDSGKIAVGMKLIRLNVLFIASLTALSAVALYFGGDRAIRILGNDKFSGSAKLLPLIFIGIGLFYIGQGLNAVGFGYNRMPKYTLAKLTGAILTVVLYLVGARFWGLSGIAWASVLTNTIYVLLTMLANRGIARERAGTAVFAV